MPTVLVTGASGFIGLHCIDQLLSQGYEVRGTVRSLNRKEELDTALSNKGHDVSNFTLYEADLTRADGWEEAVAGCDYVLHVASPFILGVPKHEDELIKPAVSGVDLRVALELCDGLSVLQRPYRLRASRLIKRDADDAAKFGDAHTAGERAARQQGARALCVGRRHPKGDEVVECAER